MKEFKSYIIHMGPRGSIDPINEVWPLPESISSALILENCKSINCSVTPGLDPPFLVSNNLALKTPCDTVLFKCISPVNM